MLDSLHHEMLAAALRTLLVVLPVILVTMAIGGATRLELIVVSAAWVVVGGLTLLLRRHAARLVATALVVALIACGAAACYTYGSVRSVGALALVAAIVLGGISLGRTALVLTVAVCAAVVGALVWGQRQGWLPRQPVYSVDVPYALQHALALAGIAAFVWFAQAMLVQALRRARDDGQRLASILRNAPGALVISSLDESRIDEINAAYERVFGFSRDEAVGHTTFELGMWTPADRAAFVEALRRDGRVVDLEVRLRRRNGDTFDALLSGELIELAGETMVVSSIDDVSAARRAHAALQASESRFRTLFEGSPVATSFFEPTDGRVVDCNLACETLLGRPRSEIIGRNGLELGMWRDVSQREHAFALFRRDGKIIQQSADVLTADGSVRHCLFNCNLVDVDGRALAIAQVLDLTEHLQAEEALRASEARFQSLFRTSPVALVVQNSVDRRIQLANTTAERMFRISLAELAGQAPGSRFWADPEHQRQFLERLLRDGRCELMQVRMARADGEPFDALISADTSGSGGRREYTLAIVDVTETRRLEQQILEAARGVSGETGEAFFHRLVEHLVRATGGDRALVGEVVDAGHRVRTIARHAGGRPAPPVVYELAASPCEQVLAGGGLRSWADGIAEQFPLDLPLVNSGAQGYIGAPLFVDGRAAGIMNVLSSRPLEHPERLEAVFRIFAARAQAELARLQREREILALNESLDQRVRERTAEVEQANRELEAFSYSVSHDLRAPLRGIDGFARLLEERHVGALPDEARQYLRRVRAGTQRMGTIIDDLLQLARVGRGALAPRDIDLSLLARGIAAELSRSHPERRVQWTIEDGIVARADAGLIHIVLTNLLGNAFKYTGKVAEARIAFERTNGSDVPAGWIALSVADNGAGFDMAYAGQLFQPFRRLHGQHEFEGTGVGLATVRRIIERHGGTVVGHAVPGAGARFTFRLASTERNRES